MIYTAAHVRKDTTLSCDLCVVGSGAGGAPVAEEAARRGKRVIVLEAGSYWRPRDMTQWEHEMLPRLYHDKAARTTADKAIHVHQGKGVGGSTLHNLNLVKRIPSQIHDAWRERMGLASLTASALAALYEEAEARISVSTLGPEDLGANSYALKRGCERLGYRGGYVQHNRKGCRKSGYCELGCAYDAKENALKVFLASAVEKGTTVLADTWATRIRHAGRRASAVEAVTRDPATGAPRHRVTIEARAVCVSASATGTPTLLQRSAVPDPHGLVGSRLHLHPGAAVAGVFDDPLFAWTGIPQGFECTQFLDFQPGSDRRAWILPAFAHPVGVSAILGAFGAEHAERLAAYPRLGAFMAMVHDETAGRVRPSGEHGVRIEYALGDSDRAQLALGLRECARLLLAGGAREAIVPLAAPLVLERLEDVDRVLGDLRVRDHDLDVTAVHPMGTVWMGDDPGKACVDASGRYHHLDNLFVSDASLFPSSIGGPPQLTIYALALHVGRGIATIL